MAKNKLPDRAAATAGDARAQEAAVPHGWGVLAILSALMGFASISTDLYLPAMPAMAASLHADAGHVAYTISGYLIGFAIGQLAWGPISDRHGRRLPLAMGMVLFVIGSAGCASSGSIESIIAWRILQAIGACAGVVLARAIIRDLYSGARAAQMMSLLMTVMAIAPLLGPIVGGEILVVASWRAIFWALVAFGLATLASLLALPETLPPARRNHEPLARALAGYLPLFRHRRLMAFTLVAAFFYAGMFAYIAASPFAYIEFYHVPTRLYGLLFGAGVVGIMITNLVNARLVVRFGGTRLLRAGTTLAALAALVLALDARTGWGGLAGLALPLFVFISMTGLVVANSIAGALADFPRRAGAVSAFVGAIQYGSGILGSALVGILADGTPWPLGAVVAVFGIGAAACSWTIQPLPSET